MAKRKAAYVPLSDETRAAVRELLQSRPEPIAAKDLAKQLPDTARLTDQDVAETLTGLVQARAAFVYPPKSPKGGPRYWHRDREQLLADAISAALPSLERPVTAKELLARIELPFPMKEPDVAPAIAACVENGVLKEFPPPSAKGKTTYWHRGILEYYEQLAVQTLEAKGPLAEAKLKTALKGISAAQFTRVVDNLEASGGLKRHPPVGKGAKELLATTPPQPEPYFREMEQYLSRLVHRLTQSGVARADLRRAVVQMLEAAGVSLGSPDGRSSDRPAAANDAGDSVSGEQLVTLMRQLEPGADRGALIGTRDLRRRAQAPKDAFDTAVLQLAQGGRVSLHRHDFPANLSPEERDELVTDGRGNYFIGIALRQSGA